MSTKPQPNQAAVAWIISKVVNESGLELWFDDGKSVVGVLRGGPNVSCRLIAQTQGFLDITMVVLGNWDTAIVDFNGVTVVVDRVPAVSGDGQTPQDLRQTVLPFTLSFSGDGSFTAVLDESSPAAGDYPLQESFSVRHFASVFGSFKPFPDVSEDDVTVLREMISQKYVPYQNIPDAQGKPDEEIRELGARFFPWSPYSYELAMSVYDWTTASFMRMVLMKVFQYTSIDETPFPLDSASIALMIWESNWGTYTPSDKDYMHSFMMEPAESLEDVERQLAQVSPQLHQYSAVENRLLAAATQSMPRTCILAKPYLFSGQVDIYQMGIDRFGIEMLEFPGNAGPVGQMLEVEFATAIASFVKPGSIITTKMVWSFTDSIADAMHYANGIVLVAEPPPDANSFVWDIPTYVTDLSDSATKIEYIFPPETHFLVQSVEQAMVEGSSVQIIRLQVQPKPEPVLVQAAPSEVVGAEVGGRDTVLAQSIRDGLPSLDQVPIGEPPKIDHVKARKTNGRRCRCVKE